MGSTSYSRESAYETRSVKSTFTNTVDQNFKQNVERKAHKEMKSQGVTLREAHDSDTHPNTFPIIFVMDVTGSMHDIPQDLIKDGLPKLISGIIQGGVQSPSLLFLAVGDHTCDTEPLQIGQFESGDKELDMWLERTYLEGAGGGNEGESYSLAHYFAARHVETDAWDKRKQKGLLVIIGDEPGLENIPGSAIKEIMGTTQASTINDAEILAEAQEKWEVFHINPRANQTESSFRPVHTYWKNLLGQNYLIVKNNYEDIPNMVRDLVLNMAPKDGGSVAGDSAEAKPAKDGEGKIML